ncbi:hypothetical protein B0H13DRAFT_2393854 [Mycena leptocephala]|nr:hypothetical protein B0H13DRAFT_2393854 [Mycena leptocephala]
MAGGFYLTPNEADARAFGAVYRKSRCANRGGLRISRLLLTHPKCAPICGFDTELTLPLVLECPEDARTSIRKSFDIPDDYPEDEDPAAVKTPAEIAVMRANPSQNKVSDESWAAYDDLVQYDVIFGAISLDRGMQRLMDTSLKYHPEITQGIAKGITGPFPQVVLVTDAAMHGLSDIIDVTNRPVNANQEATESLVPRTAHLRREFKVAQQL